jgi:hypothetical protein
MKFISTIEHHVHNPGGSVEQYARTKRLSLAQEIRGAVKIYLDTRFWLLLRDVRLSRPVPPLAGELLCTLETLVKQKRALCPISVDTFAEVFKQSDPDTLRATVQLIDDLSLGVSILELRERLQLEVFHFVREKTMGCKAVHTLDDLVWTKTAYVLGFMTPTFHELPAETNVAMQKAFVDQMWGVTLVDMLDQMGADADAPKIWFSNDVTDTLNAGKFSHAHEYSSFKQLFLNELAGILDVDKPMFADLMRHIYEADTRAIAPSGDAALADSGRLLANLIYHAFRLNRVKAELPSYRVLAGLHAAVRWDSTRKYDVNDLHDGMSHLLA